MKKSLVCNYLPRQLITNVITFNIYKKKTCFNQSLVGLLDTPVSVLNITLLVYLIYSFNTCEKSVNVKMKSATSVTFFFVKITFAHLS